MTSLPEFTVEDPCGLSGSTTGARTARMRRDANADSVQTGVAGVERLSSAAIGLLSPATVITWWLVWKADGKIVEGSSDSLIESGARDERARCASSGACEAATRRFVISFSDTIRCSSSPSSFHVRMTATTMPVGIQLSWDDRRPDTAAFSCSRPAVAAWMRGSAAVASSVLTTSPVIARLDA